MRHQGHRPSTTVFATLALAAACVAPSAALDDTTPGLVPGTLWTAPEPGALNFRVYRNGNRLGDVAVTFEQDGEDWIVTTDIDFEVRIGPIVAYRYLHDSREVWRDGQLQSSEASTLRDGDTFEVTIERTEEGGFNVTGDQAPGYTDEVAMASSWWNAAILTQDQLIGTQYGNIIPVTTTELGRDTVIAAGARVEATHFEVSGTIDLNIWYTDEGQWVKTQFTVGDNNIDYRLISGDGG